MNCVKIFASTVQGRAGLWVRPQDSRGAPVCRWRREEEGRKRWGMENLHFCFCGWLLFLFIGLISHAISFQPRAHFTWFYPQFPNHWLVQGLSPPSGISALSTSIPLYRTESSLPASPQPIFPQHFYLVSPFFLGHVLRQNGYRATVSHDGSLSCLVSWQNRIWGSSVGSSQAEMAVWWVCGHHLQAFI